MTEYGRGYLDGVRDARRDLVDDPGDRIGEHEAERLLLASLVGDEPDPEAEGSYWLGYWHGRCHVNRGEPAPAARLDEIPSGI